MVGLDPEKAEKDGDGTQGSRLGLGSFWFWREDLFLGLPFLMSFLGNRSWYETNGSPLLHESKTIPLFRG